MAQDNFKNVSHALRTGGLLAELMKAGIESHPVADADNDFTDVIVLKFPDGMVVAIRVLPDVPELETT